ncbi:MAG: hypothetical protein SPH93_12000 [Clostridium sp.]|uniref:hypothetical protein n=1 Tax=Clostridium sp. TaxID=1506 RepID=UPI002A90F99F|nr:hypothetical protein [Clostridium sp.]MDY6228361.1 hypothetical protein [Clostridium sp.]
MNTCPYCGAINSVAPIRTPDGDKFTLVASPANGNFTIPPKGIDVQAFGCTKCGGIILGNQELIGKNFTK